jgi:hypothetical protein
MRTSVITIPHHGCLVVNAETLVIAAPTQLSKNACPPDRRGERRHATAGRGTKAFFSGYHAR